MSLSAAEWLELLATFKTSSPSGTHLFIYCASLLECAPVPVGVHNGYTYYIQPGRATVPPSQAVYISPIERARGLAEDVVTYEGTNLPGQTSMGRPDWKYGFGLGTLAHFKGTLTDPSTVSPNDLVETGFFVLLNMKDRSLWITIDTDPPETFTSVPGTLPNDTRLQIGTMRISQPKWEESDPPKLNSGDPFVKYPALPCSLTYHSVVEKVYLDAIAPAAH